MIMKCLNIILSALLLLLSESCERQIKYDNSSRLVFADFPEVIQLEGQAIEFDEPIMRPSCMYIIDSFLILKEDRADFLLHKYNLNNSKKESECFTFGSGPNEFLWIQSVQVDDSCLWLADGQNASISRYNKNNVLSSDSLGVELIQKVSFEDHFKNIIALSDSQFVTIIANTNHKRLSFYDIKGDFLETKGDFPHFGNDFSGFENLEGFVCSMVLSPNKDYLFLFCMHTDLIEIYNLSGELKKIIHGPDHFFPEIRQIAQEDMIRVASIPEKTRDAYFCPVVVNDKIYVLYSGAYYDPEKPAYLLSNIFVFDNEGVPLRKYCLDIPICNFAIDSKTETLYGLSDDPEFHVIKYQL